jgi:hypothetical protein
LNLVAKNLRYFHTVIPPQTGIRPSIERSTDSRPGQIPAFAGMTFGKRRANLFAAFRTSEGVWPVLPIFRHDDEGRHPRQGPT